MPVCYFLRIVPPDAFTISSHLPRRPISGAAGPPSPSPASTRRRSDGAIGAWPAPEQRFDRSALRLDRLAVVKAALVVPTASALAGLLRVLVPLVVTVDSRATMILVFGTAGPIAAFRRENFGSIESPLSLLVSVLVLPPSSPVSKSK